MADTWWLTRSKSAKLFHTNIKINCPFRIVIKTAVRNKYSKNSNWKQMQYSVVAVCANTSMASGVTRNYLYLKIEQAILEKVCCYLYSSAKQIHPPFSVVFQMLRPPDSWIGIAKAATRATGWYLQPKVKLASISDVIPAKTCNSSRERMWGLPWQVKYFLHQVLSSWQCNSYLQCNFCFITIMV